MTKSISLLLVLSGMALSACGNSTLSDSSITSTADLGSKGDKGEKGDTGAAGPKGDTGATGPQGQGFYIASGFDCSLTRNGYVFNYQAVTYSSGDVFVVASITDGVRTSSQTKLYKSTQNGATTKAVNLVFDTGAPYNFGYWRFNTDSLKSATYVEYGSVSDGQYITYVDSDCVSY